MGLSQLPAIVQRLMAAGRAPDTPAAVVSGGCAPHPAAVRAPLEQLPEAAERAGVLPPAVIVVGETAALIFTAGTVAGVPEDLFHSGRTLAIHMYALFNEGLYMDQAYATAVVLLGMVVLINALSAFIAKKVGTKYG